MQRNLFLSAACLILVLSGCAERQDANLSPAGSGVLAFIGRTPVRGAANDVSVVGNLAYVADEPFGLSIYDISDPASPQLIDSLSTINDNKVDLIAVDPTGRVTAVQSVNNLLIYDLLSKQFIVSTGSANHVEIELLLSNDTLFVYRSDKDALDGFVLNRYMLASSGDTLSFGSTIYDSYFMESTYGFAIGNDDEIFLTRNLEGILTADCSAAGNANTYGVLNTSGKARDAALAGDILCVAAGYEGLLVFDVSDPTAPEHLGSLLIQNATDIEWVEVVGDRAYLLDDHDGVFAADISDPYNPVLIGSVDTSDPNNFFVADGFIYIADEDLGLVVVQILY